MANLLTKVYYSCNSCSAITRFLKINMSHILATGYFLTDHVLSFELVFLALVSSTKIPTNRRPRWIAMHMETEISVFALYALNYYPELINAYLRL